MVLIVSLLIASRKAHFAQTACDIDCFLFHNGSFKISCQFLFDYRTASRIKGTIFFQRKHLFEKSIA